MTAQRCHGLPSYLGDGVSGETSIPLVGLDGFGNILRSVEGSIKRIDLLRERPDFTLD